MICASLQWSGTQSPLDFPNVCERAPACTIWPPKSWNVTMKQENFLGKFPHGVLLQKKPKKNYICASGISRQGQPNGSYSHSLPLREKRASLRWLSFWIQAVKPHWRESEEVKSEHWLANATDSTLRVLSLISHTAEGCSLAKCVQLLPQDSTLHECWQAWECRSGVNLCVRTGRRIHKLSFFMQRRVRDVVEN